MKIIIFAGGSGTRLWPLSRNENPKQFRKMFDGKSTLELAIDRVSGTFGLENIYISTNNKYFDHIKEQIPFFPTQNIILEPERRDLAPAVGLNLTNLRKSGYRGPVAILWADHLMKNVSDFTRVLKEAENYCTQNPKKICFISEKPRFASNNLGWIKTGNLIEKSNDSEIYEFLAWKYKPETSECEEMFKSNSWFWNPGYFVFDLDLMLEKFSEHQPSLYNSLLIIENSLETSEYNQVLNSIYPNLEKINFDKAIAEKIKPEEAVVLKADMGWSDPGTLFALKEALVGDNEENYVSGLVYSMETKNSLVINEEPKKLVTTLGLENMVIVNTDDALIIVPKDKVVDISKLVEELKSNPDFKKYT